MPLRVILYTQYLLMVGGRLGQYGRNAHSPAAMIPQRREIEHARNPSPAITGQTVKGTLRKQFRALGFFVQVIYLIL